MKKTDIIVALVIGELIALLSFGILKNLDLEVKLLYWIWPIFLPVFCLVCLYLALFLSKTFKIFWQLAKFILVGVLNTVIDLGILNVLILFSGIVSGFGYSIFKAVSFIAAAVNSYFWNKFWTFEKKAVKPQKVSSDFLVASTLAIIINILVAILLFSRLSWVIIGIAVLNLLGIILKPKIEFLQFFIITATSFSINVGTASFIVNSIGVQFGLSPEWWANIGAITASFAGLSWNFLGYKFIVFKK